MGQNNQNQGSSQKPQSGQAGRDVNTSSTQRDQSSQQRSSDTSRQQFNNANKKDM